jgi:hypothetical protein
MGEWNRVHWVLRVGVAACFIGHGAFGIITKASWLPFFAFAGIGPDAAYRLMPVIGAVDVTLGVIALVSPRPALLLYMAVWSFFTAALRPLTGDHVWEMVERAGNFGVPLMLLATAQWPRTRREWFASLRLAVAGDDRRGLLAAVAIPTIALLLIGHGALGMLGAPTLVTHAALVGGPDGAPELAFRMGLADLAGAAMILWNPTAGLAALICGWKIASEGLFIAGGAPVWEFVERSGSYAAPMALALLGLGGTVPTLTAGVRRMRMRRGAAIPVAILFMTLAPLAHSALGAQGLRRQCGGAAAPRRPGARMPPRPDESPAGGCVAAAR